MKRVFEKVIYIFVFYCVYYKVSGVLSVGKFNKGFVVPVASPNFPVLLEGANRVLQNPINLLQIFNPNPGGLNCNEDENREATNAHNRHITEFHQPNHSHQHHFLKSVEFGPHPHHHLEPHHHHSEPHHHHSEPHFHHSEPHFHQSEPHHHHLEQHHHHLEPHHHPPPHHSPHQQFSYPYSNENHQPHPSYGAPYNNNNQQHNTPNNHQQPNNQVNYQNPQSHHTNFQVRPQNPSHNIGFNTPMTLPNQPNIVEILTNKPHNFGPDGPNIIEEISTPTPQTYKPFKDQFYQPVPNKPNIMETVQESDKTSDTEWFTPNQNSPILSNMISLKPTKSTKLSVQPNAETKDFIYPDSSRYIKTPNINSDQNMNPPIDIR